MSIYIQIINKIRPFYDPDWLTPSQKRAYEAICERLWFPSEYLNLYGAPGVGKTFLAWVLFKEQRLFYYPTINWLGRDDRDRIWGVIIDNARSDRKGARETILKLQMNKVHKRGVDHKGQSR